MENKMTDKTTDAANAWLILNDADVVEKKFMDMFYRLFGSHTGQMNRELFANMMMNTPAARGMVQQTIEGELNYRLNDTLKRTLESAEVIIQDNIRTFTPQIAVRFYAPNGGSFVVYPKVSRV
jgi:hypothetical protein